jgi:3-hydroxyisobutyrate dehydrogenase-like beta-hydroxyacid dehydrogenase
MKTIRTGFIGLGSQGGPMAERIQASGFPLTVWARRPEALEPFVERGATAAPSIAALGAQCDHVGVCVVDDAGVQEVCEQLLPAMPRGSLLAVHSTVLPALCEQLAERCSRAGLLFLDAPVSGGGAAAESRRLTVICGGAEEALERARPVLSSFSDPDHLLYLGRAGNGQRSKLINNALFTATLGLAHAALTASETLDIDRAGLTELIQKSSARSFAFDIYANLPSPSAFDAATRLLIKDVSLLAETLGDDRDAAVLRAAAAHFLHAT